MEFVTLNNGIKMPMLGYGVYQVTNEECERCVQDALDVGSRSIDTAQAYGNEEAVGRGIKNSGVARDQIFLTTKVWVSNGGYENAKRSIEESLKKLDTDYIDLLLIHQPFNDGKSAAQTALRFLLQSNVVVIPKSTHKERMEQNFDVFDFALSAEDMTTIQGLDEGESLFFSHYDPATVEMITGLHR